MPLSNVEYDGQIRPEPIAIIGMGCKFPGANSPEEYWSLLDAGRSMTTEPPTGRFPAKSHTRSTDRSIFFGNFLDNIKSFDHRFFKKSSRESASMDPQQRLLLEVAYHTLESSGFFGNGHQEKQDIGCFVGVCASDYNDNVASHPANAFSTLGTLRAFLTGKISHFFGFSGPSITFDTACSSSVVAIDAACKAIRNGDCTSALAGGVSIFTSPYFYQNLAAASFLSPTGDTKSFDTNADGYCRGEGVGLVMLKSLAQAEANQDHILGTIRSSLVQQSSNKVPITVPYSPSQTGLYRRVLHMANVSPDEVSVLEAHGTGTPIGDPQEFEGIREVFGTDTRQIPLYFSSVKGNIGHTEGASGVAGLIKLVLMMQKSAIPRQASYTCPNSKMSMDDKNLRIPMETKDWDVVTKIACLNNYGAAGSIAAVVVEGYPYESTTTSKPAQALSKHPILITGDRPQSLADNCAMLRQYLHKIQPDVGCEVLGSIAFELARTQNPLLPHAFISSVSSIAVLDDQLRIAASTPERGLCQQVTDKPNPVVLIFGGQTNRSIGLSRDAYEGCVLLQRHLDECDVLLKELGHAGLYPTIFSCDPIDDVVTLQSLQFALQYACAQSWLTCGLEVDCVIGHSFGQLVALTVSEVLCLRDGIRLAHGRAMIMQERWGAERGSMVALDVDHGTTVSVIADVKKMLPDSGLEIACYNGPRSHVLVGSTKEIECVTQVLGRSPTIKYKVLNVTHGFHSRFCDSIMPALEELANSLTYRPPAIHLETTSSQRSWDVVTSKRIAEHMRFPVYFEDSVKRIEARYGSCTWIEAGSNSSVTTIARRCLLDTGSSKSNLFFPANLSRKESLATLADSTADLWRSGYKVHFWPHNSAQRQDYCRLTLFPYQFEKIQHWLDFRSGLPGAEGSGSRQMSDSVPKPEPTPVLLSFQGFDDTQGNRRAIFAVDPRCETWNVLVSGHAVLDQPLCPAPLYVELVLRATQELAMALKVSTSALAVLQDLQILSPLGLSSTSMIEIVLSQVHTSQQSWHFTFSARERGSDSSVVPTYHATGRIRYPASDEEGSAEVHRFSRLLRPRSLASSTSHEVGHDTVAGSVVYSVFARVVQYHDFYRGVRHVVSRDDMIVAQVSLPENQPPAVIKDSLTDPVAVDNFLQVPGIYANCLLPCPSNEVHVCTGIDRIQFSSAPASGALNERYDVYVFSNPISDKEVHYDVFALHCSSKKLSFIAHGVKFSRVRISSLAKTLCRANNVGSVPSQSTAADDQMERHCVPDQVNRLDPRPSSPSTAHPQPSRIEEKLRQTLSEVTEVPANMFQGDVTLADLGIDSLMATEIVSVLGQVFDITVPQDKWRDIQTFASLCGFLEASVPPDQAPSVQASGAQDRSAEPFNAMALPDPSFTDTNLTTHGHTAVIAKINNLLATHLECEPGRIAKATNLSDAGLDSLLCIELMSDLQKLFGVTVDLAQLTTESNFDDLVQIVLQATEASNISTGSIKTSTSQMSTTSTENLATPGSEREMDSGLDRKASSRAVMESSDAQLDLTNAPEAFESIKPNFTRLSDRYQLSGFYDKVMSKNSKLVLAYTVEAFAALGVDLSRLTVGERIPQIDTLPKHDHLRVVLYEILRHGEVADFDGISYLRSDKTIDLASARELFESIVQEFPQHAKEHQLLDLCGVKLAQLMTGIKDPLTLLFGQKQNRDVLESVYSTGPMYVIMSQMLTSFLEKTLHSATPGPTGSFRIIELGAGTGATTKWVVERLVRLGIPIEYTFTDISSSLVSAAKRKFAKYDCMRFEIMDIEKAPILEYHSRFDIVLSTNCVHATSDLRNSLRNIQALLQPQGFVSLVEFTSRMYWFDIVFGLLEGWWLFKDDRPYVLAAPEAWRDCMTDVGFQHVSWTGGSTRESEIVRIITGFKLPCPSPENFVSVPQQWKPHIETIVFKYADGLLPLRADIYLPNPTQAKNHNNWAIGLVVHGGGHVMLSRKDIRPRQNQLLLDHGILPVAVDYRLCPETTLSQGPVVDVCDAYAWAHQKLPSLPLFKDTSGSRLRVEPEKVVVIGWSTGGTLAMSLAWTSLERGLAPPIGILAFYCPTDYEDQFWTRPNIPIHSESHMDTQFNILEGVRSSPITAYNVSRDLLAAGGWMTVEDARSRLLLHMNWHGQTLQVLLNGLPSFSSAGDPGQAEAYKSLPPPAPKLVRKVSPLAQIRKGTYRAPTHVVFGTKDDLIPWQQAQRTLNVLHEAGVDCGLTLVEDAPHLFDMYRDPDGKRWQAVLEGYDFLFRQLARK